MWKITYTSKYLIIQHTGMQSKLSFFWNEFYCWSNTFVSRLNYLSCCSFFTSLSSAWKSIDSRATIELTSSIPDSKVKISFLPSAHSLVLSRGEIKLIRTRQGRIGRISLGVHFDNSVMSTFWIALNTLGVTTKLKFILASPHTGQRAYIHICIYLFLHSHHRPHHTTLQHATAGYRPLPTGCHLQSLPVVYKRTHTLLSMDVSPCE